MKKQNKEKAINELFQEKTVQGWEKKPSSIKKWVLLGLVIATLVIFTVLYREPILNKLQSLDVPIMNKVLNKVQSEPTKEDTKVLTIEEWQQKVSVAYKEITELKSEIKRLEASEKQLLEQVNELKPYKEAELSFKEQKEAWDTSIASDNPDMFIAQFKTFYPDVAEEIFVKLTESQLKTKKEQDYLKVITETDSKHVGEIIKNLLNEDEKLAVTILQRLSTTKLTEIVSSLEQKTASKVLQVISPFED